jgi:sugar lactone lactonase YvrE
MNPAVSNVQRVSLAHPRLRATAPAALDASGARVVLGAGTTDIDAALATPITPAANSLFGPRGATVTADGALWVTDTGHHRLLGWQRLPQHDGTPADWLIGQPTFSREGRNAHEDVNAHSLNVPTGICACGDGLAVADAWNHRVLIWDRAPHASHQPADRVLGQADFASAAINRGRDRPAGDTLYWPYGVYWDGIRLWVADTGNRRVLCWNGLPGRNGAAADRVLGQPDFEHRDENAGAIDAASLRWPHAITHWRGRLCVADAGNNRILMWSQAPSRDHAASDALLGQSSALGVDHNRGEYWPTAGSFNMPYGLAVHRDRLFVADTANSRLLRFDAPDTGSADAVAAQAGFTDKGDNRWLPAARDSLCWPYALAVHGDTCVIADSGNNRVLLWDICP